MQAYPAYGIIGFVPVVFVPNCPGNGPNMQNVQSSFPNAMSYPYSCNQCQSQPSLRSVNDIYRYVGRLGGARSKSTALKEIHSMDELEHLLKMEIKPSRRVLKRIGVHPRVLMAKDAEEPAKETVVEPLKDTQVEPQKDIKS